MLSATLMISARNVSPGPGRPASARDTVLTDIPRRDAISFNLTGFPTSLSIVPRQALSNLSNHARSSLRKMRNSAIETFNPKGQHERNRECGQTAQVAVLKPPTSSVRAPNRTGGRVFPRPRTSSIFSP